LFSQIGDVSNVFFGLLSGNANTTGSANTGFGDSSLRLTTSGFSNTAIGTNSGRSNTTGSTNTFVGTNAGNSGSQLVSATNSTAIGNGSYTDKSNQMVFGNASVSEFVFNRNTGAVLLAPIVETTGDIRLPNFSFLRGKNTSGVNRVLLGYDGTNNTRINAEDNDIYFTAGSVELVRFKKDGKVGIGTASPAAQLSVVTSSNGDGIQIRRNSATTNDYARLGFRVHTTEESTNLAEIRGVRTNRVANFDTDLTFHTLSNFSVAERLRIRDDGLVGINETSPSAQLVVKSGAIDRVPLIVNTIASHTEDLARFNFNNVLRVWIESNGRIRTASGIYQSTFANGGLNLPDTGPVIVRNVATSDPALIVNSQQGTSHIQVWQFGGNAVSQIGRNGVFIGESRPRRTDITANATLALADEGKVLRVNPTTAADNITITIPKNSAVAFPVDTEIAIVRYNSGTVSIAPVDGDVTLQSANAERKIRNRYASVALKKIGTDEWVLVGSLEA
jgi:hypothetical protein